MNLKCIGVDATDLSLRKSSSQRWLSSCSSATVDISFLHVLNWARAGGKLRLTGYEASDGLAGLHRLGDAFLKSPTVKHIF